MAATLVRRTPTAVSASLERETRRPEESVMDARRPLLLLPAILLAAVTFPAPAAADVPTCFGKPATLVGTSGNDVLKGSGGDDVIWAGPGWDVVWGYEGNDLICLADPADPAPDPNYGAE